MAAVTIPILPSRDFDETSAFYARIGFNETDRYPGEYLIVRNDIGIELHFFAKDDLDPDTNDAGCYVRFDSADEADTLYQVWRRSGLGWEHLRSPEDTDYGLREFAVLDCHGNLLRIGGPVSPDGES